MISAPVYTVKGEAAERLNLPGEVFEVKVAPTLLAQAVRVYLSNQRKGGAKTKTRGMVSLTTAKMYKQKGTGRARHGSYSAPIFVGGGVAHGPTGGENWKLKLPAKMTKKALLGALSIRAREKKLIVISDGDKASNKTKDAAAMRKKMKEGFKEALIVVTAQQKDMARQWRNIEKISVVERESLNTYKILEHEFLIITSEAIKELKEYVDNK